MSSRSVALSADSPAIWAMEAMALLIMAGLLRPRSTVAVDATVWHEAQS